MTCVPTGNEFDFDPRMDSRRLASRAPGNNLPAFALCQDGDIISPPHSHCGLPLGNVASVKAWVRCPGIFHLQRQRLFDGDGVGGGIEELSGDAASRAASATDRRAGHAGDEKDCNPSERPRFGHDDGLT
jgi:hypothetical protein